MIDPMESGKLIVLLGGIAAVYLRINKAMREMVGKGEGREITNNPLHVQKQSRPATLEDVKRIERRVDHLEGEMKEMMHDEERWREKMRDDMTDLRIHLDDKMTDISSELREIGRAVGRLEGR